MTKSSKPQPSYFFPYSDGDLYTPAIHEVYKYPVHPYGTAAFGKPITDNWIHAELNLPQEE